MAAAISWAAPCGNAAISPCRLSVSQPVYLELVRKGVSRLSWSGAIVRTAFCGPCFGAGDTPANNGLSASATPPATSPTAKAPSPARPARGVALMDARSIAATAANGGILTPATDIVTIHEDRVHLTTMTSRTTTASTRASARPNLKAAPGLWPNIKDWPEIEPLGDDMLLKVCSKIMDPVTTTDELIPSGETSSYRSNPLGLAEFTLSRRDPAYVGRAKAVRRWRSAALPASQQTSLRNGCDAELAAVPGGAGRCRRQGDRDRLHALCQEARRRLCS